MISIKYRYQNETLKELTVRGHAGYQTKGKDIVCAAVSTATIVTANALKQLKLDSYVNLVVEDGYFNILVHEHTSVLDGLLANLEYTFYELEKQYPKYMKNQKEG